MTIRQPLFSVVVPVFNEKESLAELADRIEATFEAMARKNEFELLFVDDGSTDGSREVIQELCARRPHVKRVFLRRNCGKSVALSAGFMRATGDYVVTLDGDLQDSPEDIPKLTSKLEEGYDLVSGWRQKRHDSLVRVWGSYVFNLAVSLMSGLRLHDFNCGFKIYRRSVIRQISVYGQYHRFIPLLAHVIGFKVSEVQVSNGDRRYGASKYPAFRYQGFFDLMSILFTYKYRFSPLHFFGAIGIFLMTPSLLVITYLVGEHMLYLIGLGDQFKLYNRPLLALAFTVNLLGANIFMTGLVCDFVLHHTGTASLRDSVSALIEDAS